MLQKILAVLFTTIITSGQLLACPMCSGQDPRDKNYIYIVGIFILLIYVPMFYLYKTVMKYKNINNNLK